MKRLFTDWKTKVGIDSTVVCVLYHLQTTSLFKVCHLVNDVLDINIWDYFTEEKQHKTVNSSSCTIQLIVA